MQPFQQKVLLVVVHLAPRHRLPCIQYISESSQEYAVGFDGGGPYLSFTVPGVPPLVTIASRCGMSLRRSSLSFGVPLSRLCLLLQIQGLASMQACAPACVGSELQMTRKWSIYKGPSKIQNLH